MLYVRKQKLETVEDLRIALDNAMKLEFATIPPYLTALYSIKDGKNVECAARLRVIVVQEMLHLSLAANILNAVGGKPDFPGCVPKYPGPLPMGIGSDPPKKFIVPLEKLSRRLVKETFMVIEEPEHPLDFPEAKLLAVAPDYHTIGEFYEAVSQLIGDLPPSIFSGDPKRQVTGWFPPDWLHPVTDAASAQSAIQLIVEQGEGSSTSPLGGKHGLAHYYRFEEIYRGKTLKADPSVPQGYSWGEPAIPLDENEVWNIVDNAPDVKLPKDTPVEALATTCDRTFSALVDALQVTFDGDPGHLDASVGLMYTLRLQAQELMSMPIPDKGANAAPRFLYDSTTASG